MDLSEYKIDWESQPDEEALALLERRFVVHEEVANGYLNPEKGIYDKVRTLVGKLGIPGLLIYNGGKAITVGAGAYMVCPGEMEVKALAAGAAGIGLLSASPTFWAAGALITAKIGKKAYGAITSPKL